MRSTKRQWPLAKNGRAAPRSMPEVTTRIGLAIWRISSTCAVATSIGTACVGSTRRSRYSSYSTRAASPMPRAAIRPSASASQRRKCSTRLSAGSAARSCAMEATIPCGVHHAQVGALERQRQRAQEGDDVVALLGRQVRARLVLGVARAEFAPEPVVAVLAVAAQQVDLVVAQRRQRAAGFARAAAPAR